MKRFAEIISPLLKELGLETGIRLELLKRRWDELLRPPLCLHLYPISIKDRELIVNVSSSMWLQEITLHKEDILILLKPFGLTDVRFRLGRVPRRHDLKAKKGDDKISKCTLSPQLLRYIEKTLEPVSDKELREVIRPVIEKSLSRIR